MGRSVSDSVATVDVVQTLVVNTTRRGDPQVNPSEQYRAAGAELTQLAATLEGGGTDAVTALGTTLRVLQQLLEVEPLQGTAGALRALAERHESRGTMNPERLRETAEALQAVAQGHDDAEAQMRQIWS